jgi:hypothetical protein
MTAKNSQKYMRRPIFPNARMPKPLLGVGLLLACCCAGTMVGRTQTFPNQQENAEDPRGDYKKSQQRAADRLYKCALAEKQFNEYDIFRSPTTSKVYGIDVRGRIWTLQRDSAKGCSLQSKYRLNKPDYEIDYLGRRTWITFHYEDKQLCLYTREPSQKPTRRCYQPVGLISKLAPYFLN